MHKLYLFTACLFVTLSAIAQTPPAEIENILVDACGTPEGGNEMFLFKVGPNNLNTANLSVTWSSNPWLGVCQDVYTAADVAFLNSTITSCGWLIEPTGGVLPAGKEVLFITSEHLDTSLYSFAGLSDTLIVIFQCGNATTGHFKNYQSGAGPRTTILSFSGANGGADTVTYMVDSLVDFTGHHTAADGASVAFTNSQPTLYYNTGTHCEPLIPQLSLSVPNNNLTVCASNNINLSATSNGYKQIKWRGGAGAFQYTDSLNTTYYPSGTETYPFNLYVTAYGHCAGDSITDTLQVTAYVTSFDAGPDVISCGGDPVIMQPSGGVTYVWDNSPYLSCTGCRNPIVRLNASSTFYVTITDNHNCHGRDSVHVAFTLRDSIHVSADDTICGGGTSAISSYSSTGYIWTPDSSLSCNNCPNPIASPTHSTVYTLQTTGTCPVSAQVGVAVLPALQFTLSNNHAQITCNQTSLNLSISAITPGLQYHWFNGSTASSVSVSAGGIYNVTITSTTAGCSVLAADTIVTNNAAPDLSINPPAALSCATPSVTLTASSTINGLSYNWGSGNTAANLTISTAGNYGVTVTNPANGCTASASVSVTSSGGGGILVTPTVTSATCGHSNGAATIAPTTGVGPYTYNWSTGATISSISNVNAGTYMVTVHDANGCSGAASVTVTSSNNLSVSVTSVNTTCAQNNGSAAVVPQSGTGPYTYHWNNGATVSVISNLPADNYLVTVTDAAGCSATSSAAIAVSTVDSVYITADRDTMCPNDSAHICVTGTFNAYNWNTGQTSNCIVTSEAGNYYVSATESNGCVVQSNRVTIHVYQVPSISITVSGDTMRVSSTGTVQWYRNGVAIPGATGPLYVVTQSGNYQALLTDQRGCSTFSQGYQITGTEGLSANDHLTVYPNPSNTGNWQLIADDALIGSQFKLYDADGRIVFASTITSHITEINTGLPRGVYLLHLATNNTNLYRKLLKF